MMIELVLFRKSSKLPSINWCRMSVVCACRAGSMPYSSTVAFSNPERALTVPRRTGEHETTSGNCLLTRMISLGLVMPSK